MNVKSVNCTVREAPRKRKKSTSYQLKGGYQVRERNYIVDYVGEANGVMHVEKPEMEAMYIDLAVFSIRMLREVHRANYDVWGQYVGEKRGRNSKAKNSEEVVKADSSLEAYYF